jgi:hypothetical protein
MSKWYLIKYEDNWADEMDISSHTVIDEETHKKFLKALLKNPSFTMCVGTNEEIDYGTHGHRAEDAVCWKEMTQEEYNVLIRLGIARLGRFAERFIERVIDANWYENEDEDEDDKDGFWIETLDGDEIRFTDFDCATAYLEDEHGYDGAEWEKVVDSNSFEELEKFVDLDEKLFCYIIEDGQMVV